MIIGIDWDHTITADQELFEAFIQLATRRGHTVIIVTGRQANDPVLAPSGIRVIYAGDEWKEVAARSEGFQVDIWIDDSPGLIKPPQKLVWD